MPAILSARRCAPDYGRDCDAFPVSAGSVAAAGEEPGNGGPVAGDESDDRGGTRHDADDDQQRYRVERGRLGRQRDIAGERPVLPLYDPGPLVGPAPDIPQFRLPLSSVMQV